MTRKLEKLKKEEKRQKDVNRGRFNTRTGKKGKIGDEREEKVSVKILEQKSE